MQPIIEIKNVSKKFSKHANDHLSYGLRDLVAEIFGRNRNPELREDEFLAVDDVSFSLEPGDSFALIGRNGCGKTTTLKMLNGTLKPDAGRIMINGRVQALIALGAGFNPKLSGLENIFNSAAVLGLSSKETKSIIDEIIDFAELEDFIESPVKTYSSGMNARLGFSVAIHLKPEIMLIDEILGVGDHSFQNKCFGKMQELKKKGVTIILVSHAHSRVIQLCENALWLHKGKTIEAGPSKEVVNSYLAFLDEIEAKKLEKQNKKITSKKTDSSNNTKKEENQKKNSQNTIYGPFIYDKLDHIEDLNVSLLLQNKEVNAFKTHEEITIEYSFQLKHAVENLNINFVFYRKSDGLHYGKISTLNGDVVKHIKSQKINGKITIHDFNLNPGNYILLIAIFEGHSFLYRNVVKEFVVMGDGSLTYGLMSFKCHHEIIA